MKPYFVMMVGVLGPDDPVKVLSVKVSAELLLVKLLLGIANSCFSPLRTLSGSASTCSWCCSSSSPGSWPSMIVTLPFLHWWWLDTDTLNDPSLPAISESSLPSFFSSSSRNKKSQDKIILGKIFLHFLALNLQWRCFSDPLSTLECLSLSLSSLRLIN